MYYFGQGDLFNPPDYWTQMVNDPTQVPVQLYPYGSGGGAHPQGAYPGFYVGQRTMTQADAQRSARARYIAQLRRAETTDDPAYKYLSAEGRLGPRARAAMRGAKADAKRRAKGKDPIKAMQKKVVSTILLGAVLSALLR